MISETDIWTAALALVKRYGTDAMQESAMRADQLLEGGDWQGAAFAACRGHGLHRLVNPCQPGLKLEVLRSITRSIGESGRKRTARLKWQG